MALPEGPDVTSRSNSIVWCWIYYLVVGVAGLCWPFIVQLDSAGGLFLSRMSFALPPTYWLVKDAKLRRTFVPHVIQPVIANFWFLVVPTYLLSTRKWRGLMYVAIHVFCTGLAWSICYHLSVYFIWPLVFPEIAG